VFFARRVLDPEVALDLTAETFAQALASRAKFRGHSEDEAIAWIYGIARHQLGRYFRAGKTENRAIQQLSIGVPRLSEEDVSAIEREAGLGQLRTAMAAALREVSSEQREALQLRLVDELAYPEVADRLGISEESARARVSRGLRSLANHFESNPLPEEAT
jgi:RNA polymerase sigma-70 factor (ECF subfamily)